MCGLWLIDKVACLQLVILNLVVAGGSVCGVVGLSGGQILVSRTLAVNSVYAK